MKLRKIKWAGYVARMVEMRNACNILLENLKSKDDLEDLGIYDRITLEWILEKWGGMVRTGFV
jgi:hypothetical protein